MIALFMFVKKQTRDIIYSLGNPTSKKSIGLSPGKRGDHVIIQFRDITPFEKKT